MIVIKKLFCSLICGIFCFNLINISYAEMTTKTLLKSDFYELDSSEFVGNYKKNLRDFFNKRIKKSRVSLLKCGGTEKILVIPMEFKDVKFKNSNSNYEELLERTKEYYELNSCYEKEKRGITIEYKITDKVVSQYDMKHYATSGISELNDEDVSSDEMAKEAVQILEKNGFKFEEYDNNGDGIIDHLVIIHAGIGQEENIDEGFIWSHSWEIQNNGVEVGKVRALNYVTVPENTGLGVLVHELGHDFGLPDLYDTSMTNQGAGDWDVMASGSENFKKGQYVGECPCNLSAWSREFLGWCDIEEVDESKELVFKNTNGISNVYKVYLKDKYGRENKSEYYLLEYRRKINYDESLPGEGILIWHIDEDIIQENFFINYLNSDSRKMGIGLVQADGKFHLTSSDEINWGDEGDPFPGDNKYNIFGAIPNKLNFDNNGNYSFIEGRNFKLNGDKATMYIDLDIKAPTDDINTYAPLDESRVGGNITFCCDLIPKSSEYKLQISDNKDFLFPIQYNVCGEDYNIEIKENKILFSENFDNVLEKENEYYWRIAAVNPLTTMDNIVWSDIKKIVFVGDNDVDVPGNLSFDIKDDKIRVSWVKEEGAVGYIVLCNEQESYVKNNIFEQKNNKDDYRIRVRSIGKSSASELGEEIVIKSLKRPSIVASVEKPDNDLIISQYIILNISNGTFNKSGNYNETTVSIEKLPAGIKQGEVLWINDKTLKVNLESKYSFVLDKDIELKIAVSKNLINDYYGDDLKTDFKLSSNNKNHIDKLSFSFSGKDAKRIIGIKKNMEYSIDGGLTYKRCIDEDLVLNDEQLEILNESDGIIVRTDDSKYYVIDIVENNKKPVLIPEYDKNILRGLTKDMEYSFDGFNWIDYEEELDKIEGSIWVRYKGQGRVKRSNSVEFKFPISEDVN